MSKLIRKYIYQVKSGRLPPFYPEDCTSQAYQSRTLSTEDSSKLIDILDDESKFEEKRETSKIKKDMSKEVKNMRLEEIPKSR